VVQESSTKFRIILVQGLNRQIRRMCEHFGYDVTKLERVRIMNISLKGLPVGDWRDLTESELKTIYSMVEASSSENSKRSKPNSAAKKENGTPHTSKLKSFSSGKSKPGNAAGKRFTKPGSNPDNRKRSAKGASHKTGKPKSKRY
jgi:23S rRNA pseudouridine2604 synthase